MAAITTINPRSINTTGNYVVDTLNASANVVAGNVKTDHLLYSNGSPYIFTTNAAGSNTQIQFNDGNSFAGSANLTFDKTSGTLTVAHVSGDGANVSNVNAVSLNGHNDTYFASTTYVDNAISDLVNGAPAILDTLSELANAIGNDSSFVNTITNGLANKANISDLSTVATSGNYQDLNNLPTLFDGEYASLANKPTLFSGSYTDLTNKPSLATVATSGEYSDLANTPSLSTVATTGNYYDLTNKPTLFDGEYASLANKPTLFSGSYLDLTNTPTLFSGSYLDLTNTPTLGTAAATDSTDYATASQGNKADTALQPTDNVSQLTNDAGYLVAANLSGYATESYVSNAVANVIDLAPSTLDTLKELANAIGNDASFVTTIDNKLANKLDSNAFTWSNISGKPTLGNIVTVNLDGNTSNILYGNGVFASAPITYGDSNVEAYLPNYAGNLSPGNLTIPVANLFVTGGSDGYVLSTDGAGNLTWSDKAVVTVGDITLDSFTADGTQTAYSLSSTPMAKKYVSVHIDGIYQLGTTFALSGSTLTFVEAPIADSIIEIKVANPGTATSTTVTATTAGTVTTNAQPNITSVGTLTSLSITGNITSGNANLGNLATANFFSGSGNNLSNIQGANVTGQVANATVAGTVYTNAQPNITSVGTLTSLTVSGDILPSANVTYNLGNATNRFKDLYLSGNTIDLAGAKIQVDNATGNINLTPAPTVANPTPTAITVASAPPKYVTLVFPGNISTPFTGDSRYYPLSNIQINNLYATLSTATSDTFAFSLLKNGTAIGNFTISANAHRISNTSMNVAMTTTDYLTMNITGGTGGKDFKLDLGYTIV